MKTRFVSLLMIGLIGCTADEVATPGGDSQVKGENEVVKAEEPGGKAEAWGVNDSPDGFATGLEKHISKLPRQGTATNEPWASSYWPMYKDNINYRWDGPTTKSPAAKYGDAFNVAGVEDGVSANHGIDQFSGNTACTSDSQCNDKLGEACAIRNGQTSGRCIPTWYGICPGWTASAVLQPEPKYPVTYNGVTFKVNDIKALISLTHERSNTRFVSLRCNKSSAASEISFDHYGRPDSNSPECRDSNPGTYYVLLTNYLGLQGKAFAEDRTMDFEVWNQPIKGYRVPKINAVSAAEANAKIGVRPTGGSTQNRSGSVAQNAWTSIGSFPVAAGQGVKVAMTGTGDADLYVSFGSAPTASAYSCRPYTDGSNETCELAVPAGATQMFVSINGYAASNSYNLAITTGMAMTQAYQFNPNATFFYDVDLEVDYISESAPETDGPLHGDIARYTKTDKYQMILEVNADGFVIGGEWVGESKTSHPDFLWLPLSAQNVPVAGGKITYANVKMLVDASQNPPGGGSGGTTGTETTVNEAANLTQGTWKHFGPYNVAAGKTLTATLTGTGDADLYVRKVAAPTSEAYDCRPYLGNSNESCSVAGPGAVYVSVFGYTAANVQLKVKYTPGTGSGGGGPPPVFTHLNTTGSVALNEMKMFQLPIPAGKKVVIRTTAASDVDLYVMMDSAPTTEAYTARGYTDSGNEAVTFTAPSNGTLFIGVHGYAAGSFTLKTSDQ